jgi:hypothetical protein
MADTTPSGTNLGGEPPAEGIGALPDTSGKKSHTVTLAHFMDGHHAVRLGLSDKLYKPGDEVSVTQSVAEALDAGGFASKVSAKK